MPWHHFLTSNLFNCKLATLHHSLYGPPTYSQEIGNIIDAKKVFWCLCAAGSDIGLRRRNHLCHGVFQWFLNLCFFGSLFIISLGAFVATKSRHCCLSDKWLSAMVTYLGYLHFLLYFAINVAKCIIKVHYVAIWCMISPNIFQMCFGQQIWCLGHIWATKISKKEWLGNKKEQEY